MKTHIQIVAALNIAAGAFYLIAAGAIFFFMGLASGIVASQGEHGAAGMVGLVMIALCTFLAVLGLPSVIAGWGLFAEKSWARPVALVLAVLHLPNVPFGTALGIYTLWALLRTEPAPSAPPPYIQPAA